MAREPQPRGGTRLVGLGHTISLLKYEDRIVQALPLPIGIGGAVMRELHLKSNQANQRTKQLSVEDDLFKNLKV